MKEQLVNILFKEEDAKLPVLQPGTMTLKDLYGDTQLVWVTNATGDIRQIKRRDFHIVAGESRGTKRRAIVCDIDGCLNLIDGAYLQLTDGSTAQWTEIDKTVLAKAVDRTEKCHD